MTTFEDCPSYLRYITDSSLEREINSVFIDYFELTERRITVGTEFADSLYEGGILTATNWTMDPAKIKNAINYVVKKRERILMLCFEEQKYLLESIVRTSNAAKEKIVIAYLASKDVMDYIEGKLDEIP